jgi:NitT/TauT family transport system substrate-binding protein
VQRLQRSQADGDDFNGSLATGIMMTKFVHWLLSAPKFARSAAKLAIALILAGSMFGAARAQTPPLKPLKVGVIKMAALTNPWVAKQRGIFERNGLDVTLVEFRSGNEAVAAQQGGSVDIILSIPGVAMTAIERGFDLVAIAQNEIAKKAGPDSGSVQVLKDSPYQKLADLAGKKIAVQAIHNQKTVAMLLLFQRAGVDTSKLQLVELPFPSMVDALKSKQVDAASLVDPFTTQLIASNAGRVLAWDYVESIPEQPLGAWFAKSAFVKRSPDVVDGFTKSIQESIEYMLADDARARGEVVAYTGLDASFVKEMPMITWDYKVRPEKWQEVVDMMRKSGELQKDHKAEDFFSDQLKARTAK